MFWRNLLPPSFALQTEKASSSKVSVANCPPPPLQHPTVHDVTLKRQHSSTVQPYCPRNSVPLMKSICSLLCSQKSFTRYPKPMQSIPKFQTTFFYDTFFTLSFYLCLDLPGGFFSSGILSKIYAF
jgi:hypothetical protein